jgi:phosphohistidine swiveling domain-containing protein
MTPTRLAVYLAAILVALFGVVFVADALVESDAKRLEALEAQLLDARPSARAELLAQLRGEEPVAVVADRRRTWVDGDDGDIALRRAIDEAVPELSEGASVVASEAALTGQRASVTLRLRERPSSDPVDVVVQLALDEDEHSFSLLEVRRLR